ncbi:MAG TPA: magnesium chelatase ATPase subunit D [Pyrinomonadaceae bacterium]|jgi:magnesium chelatase subunit D
MQRRNSKPAIKSKRRQTERLVYPFTRLVGQEEMKLALMLNAIDSSIGGCLIMGHRGTGKSTAVRALADLLPEIRRVANCLYGCDPSDEQELCADCASLLALDGKLRHERGRVRVVDLPLGATEDRVCGTINIERALNDGVRAFEPGLLARAHRGFLYIDEVNLLEDHLIDLLLDVAVTGRNLVEREGISIEHPAQFVLVGSGNPEEGELRPQLLDRFGLHVEIKTITDLEQRVEIVELREAFDSDPVAFRADAEAEQESLRRRIIRARKNLQQVTITRELLRHIAQLCLQLKVDGHRGELTITRAVRALAAFEGRKRVTIADVRRVATMALRHRLRRDPFEPTDSGARVEQQLAELFPESSHQTSHADGNEIEGDELPPSTPQGGAQRRQESSATNQSEKSSQPSSSGTGEQQVFPTLDAGLPESEPGQVSQNSSKRTPKRHSARHQKGLARIAANPLHGRYVRAVATKTDGARLAIDATLRAAALDAKRVYESPARTPIAVATSDLRFKSFKRKSGTLYIFAVDASGSMAANRIGQAKGALAQLLQQSYVKRDRVALVCFRQQSAEVLLPPSRSATRAKRILDALPVGGSTPLAAGLLCAFKIAERASRQNAERIILLLFTDGRSNVSLRACEFGVRAARQSLIGVELEQLGAALQGAGVETIVVDTQNRFTSRGEALALATRLRGRYVYLPSKMIVGQNGINCVGSGDTIQALRIKE